MRLRLTNEKVTEHMSLLFGEEHYNDLIEQLFDVVDPKQRELIILNKLAEAIKDCGIKYVLPFRFIFEGRERTSHYLIFASKKFLGYHIMKSIMYGEGEKDLDGVGKYEFIPSCNKCGKQLSLIDMFNSSLSELKRHLIDSYAGKHGTVYGLYEHDSIYNRYLLKHYKQVLLELEDEGKITCSPIKEMRPIRKGIPTLSDKVKITFV